MAFPAIDNTRVNAAKHQDDWYAAEVVAGKEIPYASLAAAYAAIPSAVRMKGRSFIVTESGLTVEYWWKDDLTTAIVKIPDVSTLQAKSDSGLNTTSKTIVGGINEVKTSADNAATAVTTLDNSLSPVAKNGSYNSLSDTPIINVTRFGLKGDDSTNNSPLLTALIALGFTNLFFPEGTYRFSALVLLQGIKINGTGDLSVIKFTASSATFRVDTNTSLTNLRFTSTVSTVRAVQTYGTATAINNVEVSGCSFDGMSIGIYIEKGINVTPFNLRLNRNTFTSMGSHGILVIRMDDSYILDNKFTTSGINRNIEFYGGKRNKVEHNNINGGITGITCTYTWTASQARGTFVGNTFASNTVRNVYEEAISLDVRGNSPTEMAIREQGIVTVKNNAGGIYQISLDNDALYTVNKSYVGGYLCFVTGNFKGNCLEIIDMASATGTRFVVRSTAEQYALISLTDVVLIGSPFIDNQIIDNIIDCPETKTGNTFDPTGIYFNGFCYNNLVSGNIIRSISSVASKRGIIVRSLNGLDKTDSITNPPGGRKAPCENNTVCDNIVVNADIILDYLGYGTSVLYPSIGNIVESCIVQGKITVTSHQNIISNSTATSGIVLSDTVLSDKVYNWFDLKYLKTTDKVKGLPLVLTSARTLALADYGANGELVVYADASGGAFTITLLPSATDSGYTTKIVKTDASANTITVKGNGTELINNANTDTTLSTQNASFILESNGTKHFKF